MPLKVEPQLALPLGELAKPYCSCSRLTTTPLEMAQMPLKKKVTKPAFRTRIFCSFIRVFLAFSLIIVKK